MAGQLTLRHKLILARLALAVERLWPPLIPVMGLANLVLAYALYDGPHLVSPPVHGGLVVVWIGLLTWVVWRQRKFWRWPTQDQAARRLERHAGLLHHPLSVLTDRPSLGDADLWRRHRQAMAALAGTVRLRWPKVDLGTQDPWGWRYWVFVPLALGLVVGGGDAGRRLGGLGSVTLGPPPSLTVTVVPPLATSLAPFVLDETNPVSIPAGSLLQANVALSWGRASLVMDDQSWPFQGDGTQHIEQTVQSVASLSVRRGGQVLGRWQVRTIVDHPPEVAFTTPPHGEGQWGAVRVGVKASDDYGLSRIWLRAQTDHGDSIEIPLPSSSTLSRTAQMEIRIGGQEVALAGQKITVFPVAQDSAGQRTEGLAVTLTWPERRFVDPVARFLDDMRRAVRDDPAQAPQVAGQLAELLPHVDDLGQRLGLGVAQRDLDQAEPDVTDATNILWQAANDREDQGLRKLQDRVEQLGDPKTPQQIRDFADLVDKLLNSDQEDGAPLKFTSGDLAEMLTRLDQLADQVKGDAALRQRLAKLAKRMAERLKSAGQDPFGHQRGEAADGDDRSTRLPGGDHLQIQDEIQSRILDESRPMDERSYLKRLLGW